MAHPRADHAVAQDAGRVAVLHAGGAGHGAAARAECLRAETYDAWTLDVRRDVVDVLVRDQPDVVMVCWRPQAFDLGRLCRDLRQSIDARIIVVADTDGAVADSVIVDALEGGADDVVGPAVGVPLLMARVRVAMRARPARVQLPRRIVIGDLDVDVAGHIVRIAGEPVKCPPLQFQLLVRLARELGVMVRSDALFVEVWGVSPGSVDPRRLRIAVSLLRGILGSGPSRPRIETIARTGYRLIGPVGPT